MTNQPFGQPTDPSQAYPGQAYPAPAQGQYPSFTSPAGPGGSPYPAPTAPVAYPQPTQPPAAWGPPGVNSPSLTSAPGVPAPNLPAPNLPAPGVNPAANAAWSRPSATGLAYLPPLETLPGTQQAFNQVRLEVAKAVVGQTEAVSALLVGLLCDGHVLLEGVPGVAKTLLVRSLAASLDLEMKRVQFTPDLMPGDVTGSLIYDAQAARFDFRPGPVFTNLLLADEINRTPPKTQASLLEAMEERQVTADGTTHALPEPFMVIATQNPVEYEGTYPLPEAQLDRFLLKITLPLPGREDEIQVLTRHATGFDPRNLGAAGLKPVTDKDKLRTAREQAALVRVDPPVLAYVADVCRATRQAPSVSLGVSPRGTTALMKAARAWAWLCGRDFTTPDDVKALAVPTLNHRIQVRTEAQMDGTTAAGIIANVLATVPVPR